MPRGACGSSANDRSPGARCRPEGAGAGVDVQIPERLWPFFDRLFKGHVFLYRMTGGVIGHSFPGAPPMLLLDHVGAKTGKLRTTPLAYIPDGDDYVIVASKGGHPKHPAWFHNVLASPDVRIQVKARRMTVRGREATSEERARLWPKVVAAYRGYASYQERTSRQIPLVILEPVEVPPTSRAGHEAFAAG